MTVGCVCCVTASSRGWRLFPNSAFPPSLCSSADPGGDLYSPTLPTVTNLTSDYETSMLKFPQKLLSFFPMGLLGQRSEHIIFSQRCCKKKKIPKGYWLPIVESNAPQGFCYRSQGPLLNCRGLLFPSLKICTKQWMHHSETLTLS